MNKYFKYFKYILKHKWYVLIECCKYGLYWRGLVHDMSKLRPSEFITYARYFYGELQDETYFKRSWLSHLHRNKHHWQYWILINDEDPIDYLDIPMKYIIEMVCDWVGAGKAIHGKVEVHEWYKGNKKNIQVSELTRKKIEGVLSFYLE